MTNLTDEGLAQTAHIVFLKYQEQGEDGIIHLIFTALKQVRDAAKKEMRERAAKVAETFEDYSEVQDRSEFTKHVIATAIRQME